MLVQMRSSKCDACELIETNDEYKIGAIAA
jgi:hypothetical protein